MNCTLDDSDMPRWTRKAWKLLKRNKGKWVSARELNNNGTFAYSQAIGDLIRLYGKNIERRIEEGKSTAEYKLHSAEVEKGGDDTSSLDNSPPNNSGARTSVEEHSVTAAEKPRFDSEPPHQLSLC